MFGYLDFLSLFQYCYRETVSNFSLIFSSNYWQKIIHLSIFLFNFVKKVLYYSYIGMKYITSTSFVTYKKITILCELCGQVLAKAFCLYLKINIKSNNSKGMDSSFERMMQTIVPITSVFP